MTEAKQSSKKEINYSEILRNFVDPIIDQDDDLAAIQEKYAFGIHVWNAATIKIKDESLFENARAQVTRKSSDNGKSEELFNEMVSFKQDDFAAYQRVIVDFEVRLAKGKSYDLTVATAALKD